MKKQGKHKAPAEPPSKGMSLDAIMEQLSDLKDIAASMQTPRDGPEPTASRVAACEAATDILNALQDEGIKDQEQVRDLIHDYNALAEQYQKMCQHYEKPENRYNSESLIFARIAKSNYGRRTLAIVGLAANGSTGFYTRRWQRDNSGVHPRF